jgi:hypothetical protein
MNAHSGHSCFFLLVLSTAPRPAVADRAAIARHITRTAAEVSQVTCADVAPHIAKSGLPTPVHGRNLAGRALCRVLAEYFTALLQAPLDETHTCQHAMALYRPVAIC